MEASPLRRAASQSWAISSPGGKVFPDIKDEASQFGKLRQLFDDAVDTIQTILGSRHLPEDESWLQMKQGLEETMNHLKSRNDPIEKYLKSRPLAHRLLLAKLEFDPMRFPTTPASQWSQPHIRQELENLSDADLYNFFMAGNQGPMTQQMRKEVEKFLQRMFPSLPRNVIKRVSCNNSHKLSQCILNIEAWKKANCANEMVWKGQRRRMIFEYEIEELRKRPRSAQTNTVDISLPIVLELQFLFALREKRLKSNNPVKPTKK